MTIHVFGRIFMDLFIYGKRVHNSKIIETPGGSAFNASLGFSLLGLNTYIHASYGNDSKGKQIREVIEQYGVQTQYLIKQTEPTNRFVSKNGQPIAASVATECPFEYPSKKSEEDYCLLFATEVSQEMLERVITIPWKGLFIDLGPKYAHNRFPYKIDKATIIGNEPEAENNPCDVIKMGKNGARWHDVNVPGNGQSLPYTTGAGDLFDVIVIYYTLMGKTPSETF